MEILELREGGIKMIITLIFFGLFIIPTLLIILGNIVHKIYSEKKPYDMTPDELEELNKSFIRKCYIVFCRKMDHDILGMISIFGSIFLASCIVVIICMHVAVNKNIEINRIEYEGLCHRLEIVNSDYEDVSKSDVIKDISEWNKAVLYKKYWAKNPWTSWFYSQKMVDELKYIDYK